MSMSAAPAAVDVDHRAICFVTEDLDRLVGDELTELEFSELVDEVLASVVDHPAVDVDHRAFLFVTERLQRIVGDDLDEIAFADLVDILTGAAR